MTEPINKSKNKIDHFGVCKRVFNFSGIYLYKTNSFNAALCIIGYVLSFILAIYLFRKILFEDHNLLDIMYATGFITTYIKCFAIFFKRKQLIKALDTLESEIFLPNVNRGGTEEEELICNWITYLNKVCLITSPVGAIIALAAFTFWTFNKYSELPFGLFIQIINIRVTAFIQTLWFMIFGTGCVISEVAVFMVLGHLKLHLLNLQNCIKNLIQNSIDDNLKDKQTCVKIDEQTVEWKYLKKRLKQVVVYHVAILDVSKLLDEAFNLSQLFKFISLSFLLCLMIYGMAMTNVGNGFFWLQSSYALSLVILMNSVNYYGNEVIFENRNLSNCCYNVEFVGTNNEFQKGLLLLIQGSQIPITMTVGKFAPLSLTVSLTIMRATYSYFMILYKRS